MYGGDAQDYDETEEDAEITQVIMFACVSDIYLRGEAEGGRVFQALLLGHAC